MNRLVYFLLGIGIGIGIGVLLYFNYQDIQEDSQYERKIQKIDSLLHDKQNHISQLSKDTAHLYDSILSLEKRIASQKSKRKDIEDKFSNLQQHIDTLSIDSVASYIADYYGGDYIIIKRHKQVYVAFKDTLARKIGKGTVEFQKSTQLNTHLHRELSKKDSLIRLVKRKARVKDSMIDGLEYKLDLHKGKDSLQNTRIDKLERKIRRDKIIMIGGGVVAGLLIILL